MAVTRKTTSKTKTRKKVITVPNATDEIIKTEIPLSAEEKIFGTEIKTEEYKPINYESAERLYKVTNLEVNNNPITVSGDVIETFIGSDNIEARKQLIKGAESIITKDYNGKELYKIEVVG